MTEQLAELDGTVHATQLSGPLVETTTYSPGALTLQTEYELRPDDPIFAGHYPGFPIYPGVCLIECAHRSALLIGGHEGVDLRLSGLRSARFLAPAFPADVVLTTVAVKPRGEQEWEAKAKLACGAREVAAVTLHYGITA